MHLKHTCLPISPPEQVENAAYYIISRQPAQGGILQLSKTIENCETGAGFSLAKSRTTDKPLRKQPDGWKSAWRIGHRN